jgi:glycosyltransferase involved in cell wall biosynthesis
VGRSLETILGQVDACFEIVLVDNYSNDGSYDFLKEYGQSGRIKLLRARSTRGRGRQIAFENSLGEYIIANLDMDDVFKPRLSELLTKYHAVAEGKLLSVWSVNRRGFWGGGSVVIAPRELIQRLGGWNNLQIFEDWELCARAARAGVYSWGEFDFVDEINAHAERGETIGGRLRWKFVALRDNLRVGRPLQRGNASPTWKQKLFKILVGPLIHRLYGSYADPFNLTWNKSDPSCFVHLEQTKDSRFSSQLSSTGLLSNGPTQTVD